MVDIAEQEPTTAAEHAEMAVGFIGFGLLLLLALVIIPRAPILASALTISIYIGVWLASLVVAMLRAEKRRAERLTRRPAIRSLRIQKMWVTLRRKRLG
ncbi:MAG TPA: hypothetical protein VMV10_02065 [Pirellulales bacterium]|nr:hypothetical protein [Pirellulales bacterium]